MASSNKEIFDTCMTCYIGSLNEQRLDEIFQKHDKDGNGFIDAKELDGFIEEIFKEKPSQEEIKEFKTHLLERLDNNNDGKLDKNELKGILPTERNFLENFCGAGKKLCGVDFVKIWNHYDKNGNGILEGSELDGFLKDLILKIHPKTTQDNKLVRSIEKIKASLLSKFSGGESKEGLNKADLFEFLEVETTCPSFQGKSSEEFETLFSGYDKDASGAIEGDELCSLLTDLLVITDKTYANEIKDVVLLSLDKNKDNKIQKSELREFLKIQD